MKCIPSHKCYSDDGIKKNETCWARGTYRGVWWGNLKERGHLEDLGWGSRWENNITMDHQEMEWGSMGWIALARDRSRWRAVVNVGMKPSGSIKCGEFPD